MVEQQARALQAAQREAEAREKLASKSHSPEVIPASRLQSTPNKSTEDSSAKSGRSKDSEKSRDPEEEDDEDMSPPPMKRERVDSFDHRNGSPVMSGANIRIANRGESGDSSLVVSLEINSVMYQGVLFAQPGSLGSSKKISSSSNTAATTGIDRSNINGGVQRLLSLFSCIKRGNFVFLCDPLRGHCEAGKLGLPGVQWPSHMGNQLSRFL